MGVKIPISKPWLGESEEIALVRAVKSGWLTQSGHEVSEMEQSIADFFGIGSDFVTTTSNGTTALHLALMALGIGPGDEVILSSFSYVATLNAVLYCGAKPVFIDANPETWNIHVASILGAINSKTKALLIVDNYGRLADYEAIRSLLPNQIPIIQDAAESFPGPMGSGGYGNQGDISTFSFYGNKIFTAAEGGAVIADPLVINKIKVLKNQGQNNAGNFQHEILGYNYRISNLHAAIFNAQWARREEIMGRRTTIFKEYAEGFEKSKINIGTNLTDNPWLATIAIKKLKCEIGALREKLLQDGIETRPGFSPLNQMSYLPSRENYGAEFRGTNLLANSILSLPTYPELSPGDVAYIVQKVVDVVSEYTE